MIHFFKKPVSHLALPEKFTYPFHYTPHPLCVLENSSSYLDSKEKWKIETEQAKAVLNQAKAELKMAKEAREIRRQSSPELSEEEQASLIRESQYQKAEYKRLEKEWKKRLEELETEVRHFDIEIERLKTERKERSAALQRKLFEQFRMLNAQGEVKDLYTIFEQTVQKVPPAGAGECALPKLLQYAYLHQLKPLAMAEFNKPAGMLSVPGKAEDRDSVYHRLKKKYPEATGPMIVHRLDMATSGLLLVAKTKEVHRDLQAQFANRSIKKRYVAVLDGAIIKTEKEIKPIAEKAILIAKETVLTKKTAKAERTGNTGRIELPLCLNPLDRPRQMVSSEHGKEAITEYQIISESERITSESENTFNESNRIDESERNINESRKYTRIVFYPLTGRTHQLRVHAAHPEGLGCPILGDELYGKKADRLYLHAEYIEFRHPIYGDILCIQKEADFHKKI